MLNIVTIEVAIDQQVIHHDRLLKVYATIKVDIFVVYHQRRGDKIIQNNVRNGVDANVAVERSDIVLNADNRVEIDI